MGFTTLGLSAALITFSKGRRVSLRLAPPPCALLLRRDRLGGCSSQVPCVTAPCCLLSSCPCCCCWFGDWTRAQVALRPAAPFFASASRGHLPSALLRRPGGSRLPAQPGSGGGPLTAPGRGGAGRSRRTGLRAGRPRGRLRRCSGGRAGDLAWVVGPGRRRWRAWRCRGEGREERARSGPRCPRAGAACPALDPARRGRPAGGRAAGRAPPR